MERLGELHTRVHQGRYWAKPSRRVYIPKPDGTRRPLGIQCLEDKIVQQAVATVLNAIYETDFKGFSYGFRPREALAQILLELAQRVSADLARKSYLGKTIGIKLRYEDFRTLTREVTLERAIADAEAIRTAARACLKRVPLDRSLRLLGIRVAGLAAPAGDRAWPKRS